MANSGYINFPDGSPIYSGGVTDSNQTEVYDLNKLQGLTAQLATMMTQTEFDSWVATLLDGGPSIFFDTYSQLVTTYPNGAAGVALIRETDPSHIYVWNPIDNSWEDYGEYQGLEPKDNTVTLRKTNLAFVKKLDNYFRDNLKTTMKDASYTVNTASAFSNLGFKAGAPTIVLDAGYYFLQLKLQLDVDVAIPDTGYMYPQLYKTSTQRYYLDSATLENDNMKSLKINDNLGKVVEMNAILHVEITDDYYLNLYAASVGTDSKTWTPTLKDAILIKLNNTDDINASKNSFIDLVKTYGYIDNYPNLLLTDSEMKKIASYNEFVPEHETKINEINETLTNLQEDNFANSAVSLIKTNLPHVKKIANLFQDKPKAAYKDVSFSYSTSSSLINLPFITTYADLPADAKLTLDTGYYFIMLKCNVSLETGTVDATGVMRPQLFISSTVRYSTDASSSILKYPSSLNVNESLGKDVVMSAIVKVDQAGDYAITLYGSALGTVAKKIKTILKDCILIKIDDTTDLNASKASLVELAETYGYINAYPELLLTETQKSEIVSKLETRVTALENGNESPTTVHYLDYWGDSLTAGTGGNGVSRPSVMQTLLGSGWVVNNRGTGGEMSNTIACRQGGMAFVAQPTFTIPSDLTPVTINILDNNGDEVNIRSIADERGINPCYINGIKGILSASNTTVDDVIVYTYTFTRGEAGSEVVINRPTTIITNAMKNFRENPIVVYIGQNGGYNSDPDELVRQIQQMVDFNNSKKYLVISLTSTVKDAQNESMRKAFGRRYIDARQYLIDYGLADAGITPTQQDLEFIANNNVPPSLLSDGIHGNEHYYRIIANLEFRRGQELGYW